MGLAITSAILSLMMIRLSYLEYKNQLYYRSIWSAFLSGVLISVFIADCFIYFIIE